MPELRPLAGKIEPRVVRAIRRAMERMTTDPALGRVSRALGRGDIRAANRAVDALTTAMLIPTSMILQDTFVDGGKAAAKEVTRG
jgi:hypothetical protein